MSQGIKPLVSVTAGSNAGDKIKIIPILIHRRTGFHILTSGGGLFPKGLQFCFPNELHPFLPLSPSVFLHEFILPLSSTLSSTGKSLRTSESLMKGEVGCYSSSNCI